MATGLIRISDANLWERKLTKNYFTAVIDNCNCLPHFQVIFNPHHSLAKQRADNPPNDFELSCLSERLDGINAVEILATYEGHIHSAVSPNLAVQVPSIFVTHTNPGLLQEVIFQEMQHSENQTNTDMYAWTELPIPIQYHWSRFNDQLRAHIIEIMMLYLEKRPGLSANHLSSSSGFFNAVTSNHFPYIPVRAPSGDIYDLMTVLGSLNRVNHGQLMPAESEELKIRVNTASRLPRS